MAPETAAVERTAPEPTAARRARPLTDYWDHRTGSWRAAPAIPAPRRGD